MEERKDKRQLILEAAAQVFSQRGYHQAKVEEIAAAAGVGKGTVYEYFDSKLELFQQMCSAALGDYFARFDSLGPAATATERLRRTVETHLEVISGNLAFARVIMDEGLGMDEELRAWMYAQRQAKVERLRALFEEGVRAGEFRPVDPELAAQVVTGTLVAVIMPAVIGGQPLQLQGLADRLMDLLLHGLALP